MDDIDTFTNLLTPFVYNYVDTMRRHKLGVAGSVPKVSDVCAGCAVLRSGQRCADRFKLHLHYAGQTLTWETIFNHNYPQEPPDFIFCDDSQQFQPEFGDIKSLCKWNFSDGSSLLNVVNELLNQYKLHNLSLLSGSRLEFDYNALIESKQADCKPEDIEVLVTRQNGVARGPVHFLIKLKVQLSALPEPTNKDKVQVGEVLLNVQYQSADGGKVTPKFLLSSNFEYILSYCGLRPSTVPFPHEGCLVDYVLAVKSHLKNLIETIACAYEKRKEFVTAFTSLFESSIVEFDSQEFRNVSALLMWNDFSFVVSVELSAKFPTEQPKLILQSVYHVHKTRCSPYMKEYTTYPYSPRWNGHELSQRIRTYVTENIQEFQRSSVYEGCFIMS